MASKQILQNSVYSLEMINKKIIERLKSIRSTRQKRKLVERIKKNKAIIVDYKSRLQRNDN